MLIDRGMKSGDIVTIKTQAGEEIVGKFIEDTDTYVKLNRPLVLMARQGGLGLAQYLFTVDPDKDIKIYKPISVLELTEDETARQYVQQTTNISIIK